MSLTRDVIAIATRIPPHPVKSSSRKHKLRRGKRKLKSAIMKLLTRQCAGGGCRSTAAVRLVLLAGEGRERNPRSLPLPAFPQRLSDSSESKPTQTALGSFCKRGGGAGPGSLSTSFSPPFSDLPPLADLLLLPLPSRAATLRAAGKAQHCSRGEAGSTWQNRERSARCVFLRGPGRRGCPAPELGVVRTGARSGRSLAAPPRGVEEEEETEERGVSGVLPRPAG